jgi:hypothetical protein
LRLDHFRSAGDVRGRGFVPRHGGHRRECGGELEHLAAVEIRAPHHLAGEFRLEVETGFAVGTLDGNRHDDTRGRRREKGVPVFYDTAAAGVRAIYSI